MAADPNRRNPQFLRAELSALSDCLTYGPKSLGRPERKLGSCAWTPLMRWSRRARRWRLRVPWGEAPRLTVPVGTSHAEVRRLLAEKKQWIVEQQGRQVPRLGLEERVISESEARIAAREIVSALAEEEAERISVTFERIRIGGQRTLSALVLAPGHALLQLATGARSTRSARLRGRARALPPALPNHSPRFWASSSDQRPRWCDQRDWLRVYGSELLAFTPNDR